MLLSFVPLAFGAVSNSQAVRGLGNLLGKLESYQRGVNWNIPFKCRRLKPWVDFFPENIRRVEKQADSFFFFWWWGGCSGNSRGKIWGLISLAIRALPHDLVMGGIPHAGSRQNSISSWSLNHCLARQCTLGYSFSCLFVSLLCFLSSFWVYCTTSSWHANFLLKSQLIVFWEFPFT